MHDLEDPPPDIDTLAAELVEDLTPFGFDLVAHTTVAAYHRALGDRGDDPAFRLPEAPSGPSRAVVLVGNSRAVWAPFTATLAAEPARRVEAHPFDRWTSEVLRRVVVGVVGPHVAFDLRFAFEGGVRAFSAQHLAQACGLACLGPAGLAVHPTLGPWFSLRAAIVCALPGREAPAPTPLCERCADKPCLQALATATAERPVSDLAHAAVRERWRAWLAVRDACPIGRDRRYGDAQIRWHYAHDRAALADPGAPR